MSIGTESKQYMYASCDGMELWKPLEYSMRRKMIRIWMKKEVRFMNDGFGNV